MKIETEVLRTLNPDIDARNLEILRALADAYQKRAGPVVGDYVMMPGEENPRRFTHDWGSKIQTTVGPDHPCHGDTSFHLCSSGCGDFSGSLDQAIPKDKLREVDEVRPARFWFFRNGYVTAHNGLHVRMPVRVYAYTP